MRGTDENHGSRVVCPVPGYTGVLPGIVDLVGMTFGHAAKVGRQESLAYRENIRSPLSEGTIISGYQGHLPGLQSTPRGRTFSEEIVHVVSAFRDRYRCPQINNSACNGSLTPILDGPRLVQKLDRYPRQRVVSGGNAKKSKLPPAAGYTGHLPFLRTSPTANLGTTFPTAVMRSIQEFEEKKQRWEKFMSSPVSLENERRLEKIYPGNP